MDDIQRIRDIRGQFATILLNEKMTQEQKDKKYGELMTELERYYRIPALKNDEFEAKNPDLMRIYRQISNARVTL